MLILSLSQPKNGPIMAPPMMPIIRSAETISALSPEFLIAIGHMLGHIMECAKPNIGTANTDILRGNVKIAIVIAIPKILKSINIFSCEIYLGIKTIPSK